MIGSLRVKLVKYFVVYSSCYFKDLIYTLELIFSNFSSSPALIKSDNLLSKRNVYYFLLICTDIYTNDSQLEIIVLGKYA